MHKSWKNWPIISQIFYLISASLSFKARSRLSICFWLLLSNSSLSSAWRSILRTWSTSKVQADVSCDGFKRRITSSSSSSLRVDKIDDNRLSLLLLLLPWCCCCCCWCTPLLPLLACGGGTPAVAWTKKLFDHDLVKCWFSFVNRSSFLELTSFLIYINLFFNIKYAKNASHDILLVRVVVFEVVFVSSSIMSIVDVEEELARPVKYVNDFYKCSTKIFTIELTIFSNILHKFKMGYKQRNNYFTLI